MFLWSWLCDKCTQIWGTLGMVIVRSWGHCQKKNKNNQKTSWVPVPAGDVCLRATTTHQERRRRRPVLWGCGSWHRQHSCWLRWKCLLLAIFDAIEAILPPRGPEKKDGGVNISWSVLFSKKIWLLNFKPCFKSSLPICMDYLYIFEVYNWTSFDIGLNLQNHHPSPDSDHTCPSWLTRSEPNASLGQKSLWNPYRVTTAYFLKIENLHFCFLCNPHQRICLLILEREEGERDIDMREKYW